MATTYTYDEEGQLLSESRGEETTSYTYDGNYNRLTKSVTGQPTEEYSYDDADRLLSVASSAGTKSFLYDNCGRTTEEKWNGTTVKTYAWNHDDRLVSATGSWGTRSYGYNGLGSRVSETGGAGRSWLRRGAGPTSAVLKDGVNRYSAGGTFRSLAGGTSTFMGGGHKSVDALLSSSQTLTGTVRRDAFGLTKEQTGTWNQPFGFGGNFGYQTDDDTGLELLGHRYYDASIGRFLSRDPIKDGPNWYLYCLNDPVNQSDPSGNLPILVYLLAVGIVQILSTTPALAPNGHEDTNKINEELSHKKLQMIGEYSSWFIGGIVGKIIKPLFEGLKAHRAIQAIYTGLGSGWVKESGALGKLIRPDLINIGAREIVEIKPLTEYGLATGRKQLLKYLEAAERKFGGKWTGRIHYYDAETGRDIIIVLER
ncbi:MAG: hypothetical protein JNM34_06165 [Chthonomonadaceae bacterium]|nr:hypothetical protein [Chthonomonadaceae bacterium]